jgi:hypothetical protein
VLVIVLGLGVCMFCKLIFVCGYVDLSVRNYSIT